MPTPSASTPTVPLVRECRPGGLRPLLAPGGRDTYFLPDLQRLLFGAAEPIARFLPPAKWAMPERAEKAQGSAFPHVTYTIPDEILKTATPLSTLPRSELDALAEAITVFTAKARADAKGVPPYTRQCHADFRLPNPDLDPDAYWVYGGEFDRRLLILWGTEPQAGVSLTPEKALEKLRQREMSWRDKQELALKLAMRSDEPIARFLAPRSSDGGLVIAGTPVPAKKLSRLKTITPKHWRAYDEAAKAYYKKAHPDTPDIAPFEKELRAEFRLPGLRQAAGDYYAQGGGSFVIAIDAWPRESTLPLTEDPILKLPETGGVTATAAAPAGATVAAQLSPIAKSPVAKYITLAAAAVVLLVGGIFGVKAALSGSKGMTYANVKEPFKILNTRVIEIAYTKPLDPASLKTTPGGNTPPPFRFVDDKLKITEVKLINESKVHLVLEHPLEDAGKYRLTISGVKGKGGKPVEPANDSLEIVYADMEAPRIEDINAGDSKKELHIKFTKPMLKDSLTDNGFRIEPIENNTPTGRRITLAKQPDLYRLDPEGKTVVVEAQDEFGVGQLYNLTVTTPSDRAAKPNRVDEKNSTVRFTYQDKLPPRIFAVVGEGGLYEVRIDFSKEVDRAQATDEKNYTITDAAGAVVAVKKGGIALDERGRRVTIKLERAKLTTAQYKIKINEIKDRENRAAKDIVKPFTFADASASGSPKIKTAKHTRGDPFVLVTFDRPPEPTSALEVARYRVLNNATKFPEPASQIRAVSQVNSFDYQLTFADTPEAGEYVIETTSILDVFGNKSDAAESFARFVYNPAKIEMTTPLIAWAGGGATHKNGIVTLVITEKITDETAKIVGNYLFSPAVEATFQKASFDKGRTTIELKVANWPATGPVRVKVQRLRVAEAEQFGPQSLDPVEVKPAP